MLFFIKISPFCKTGFLYQKNFHGNELPMYYQTTYSSFQEVVNVLPGKTIKNEKSMNFSIIKVQNRYQTFLNMQKQLKRQVNSIFSGKKGGMRPLFFLLKTSHFGQK
jgi:hypothetical protein